MSLFVVHAAYSTFTGVRHNCNYHYCRYRSLSILPVSFLTHLGIRFHYSVGRGTFLRCMFVPLTNVSYALTEKDGTVFRDVDHKPLFAIKMAENVFFAWKCLFYLRLVALLIVRNIWEIITSFSLRIIWCEVAGMYILWLQNFLFSKWKMCTETCFKVRMLCLCCK